MTYAAILDDPETARAYLGFVTPGPLANGHEPESRVVHSGISWENYLAFDKALGDDRPGPRFYYCDGELEIMSTSEEHERIKKWLACFLEDYLFEVGGEIFTRGQATMRLSQQAGAEPDESWCFSQEKEFPDLVLEIALTSGGIRKLELYRRFQVPEVWFWRRGKLEVFALSSDGADYDEMPAGGSRLLPGLDTGLLERCVAMDSWQAARRAFRAGLRTQS